MERKITQRTIGLLVVIAFIVILLPMFFAKNQAATKATKIKEPTISKTVSSTEPPIVQNNSLDITPQMAELVNKPDDSIDQAPAKAKSLDQAFANPPKNPESPKNGKPDSKLKGSIASNTAVANETIANTTKNSSIVPETPSPTFPTIAKIDEDVKEPEITPQFPHKTKKIRISKAKTNHKVIHRSENTSSKLRSPAWVVQLGCFNRKSNALHLTEKLRHAGFKAFNREIKSANGKKTTRVYVGPESAQALAVKLSSRIEDKMNMRGIILSSKSINL